MRMMLSVSYRDNVYNRILTLVEKNKERGMESYRFRRPFCGKWPAFFVEHQCVELKKKE